MLGARRRDPAAHSGREEDAFDVVVTSLPGYGFSAPLAEPMLESSVADMWSRLMKDGLGYTRFGAHGSDIGFGVTIELGLRHPDRLIGIHLSAFYLYPPPEPWPPAVREFFETQRCERAQDVAYSRMQSTRPRSASSFGRYEPPPGDRARPFGSTIWKRRSSIVIGLMAIDRYGVE